MSRPVDQISDIIKSKSITISLSNKSIENLQMVTFSVNASQWNILIDDEYEYLEINNQALWYCLVMFELENYAESEDFLSWCREGMINASNSKLLDYYRSLGVTYQEIKQSIGSIDPFISGLDFELRSGDFQELLRYKSVD